MKLNHMPRLFVQSKRRPRVRSDVALLGLAAPKRKHGKESGYALATLMLVAALLLIAISVAVPDLKTQSKREKELELQFRAMQYVRAIQAYNRKFSNQWPTSVDALMNTNNIRFLRRKWADPMTKDGQWRFIHLGPNGAIIDSKIGLPTANAPSATGTSTPLGTPTTTPGSSSPTGFSPDTGSRSRSADTSTFSTTEISNLPIVGVASKSTDQAIAVCNGFTHYNEWEYIALPQGRFAGTGCYKGVPIVLFSQSGVFPGQLGAGQGAGIGTGSTFPSGGTQQPLTSPSRPGSSIGR
jgi:type II secretory pathway pseudopilin PulG